MNALQRLRLGGSLVPSSARLLPQQALRKWIVNTGEWKVGNGYAVRGVAQAQLEQEHIGPGLTDAATESHFGAQQELHAFNLSEANVL